MAFRRPESVLIVIYDAASRVLVLQRQDDPDFWQSVTGTLEHNELPWETASREVAEETGIHIETHSLQLIDCGCTNQYVIRDIWRHRYPPNCRYNTEYVFALQVTGDEVIKLTEHLSYQWLDKHQAIDKVWSDTNRAAIIKFVPDAGEQRCR
ncbi:dihydroneopterin triphosphate diphosphatase [Aliiglaciecola sp. LCG003]|uniref:dihydroneopterin triphosphate diphosphatase n=1 Tax=Aliiglaciecola sp. LCG003 TaxID=3053655 RepID=UPI00257403FD|nr:dihydroneopterin triphosphate diphosphatase [Aliiglaciecola sp. LCG003]WJG08115.1 dihydroneopterin triphosphate diphosphatase [Aliiglaciecola sp. LCG003]